jgi:septum site-determining protein MinC
LIVVGTVSPGAELIAEGHIHVYGRLSGRALAGAPDNSAACIFCQTLDAELVSVAGHYWLHEDLPSCTANSDICIHFAAGQLQIKSFHSDS